MRVVTCPSCHNRYTMPPHLMGPGGARVVCPTCWLSFIVTAAGDAALPRVAPALAAPAFPAPERVARTAVAAPATTRAAALAGLHALEPGPGSLAGAALRGRLFSEFGPALMLAFEHWRGGDGRGADPAEFRRALEAVTGVALAGGEEPA